MQTKNKDILDWEKNKSIARVSMIKRQKESKMKVRQLVEDYSETKKRPYYRPIYTVEDLQNGLSTYDS